MTLKFDQHYWEQYKREQHECVKLCCFCPIQKLKGYLSHFKQKSQTAVSKLEGNLIHVTSFHYIYNDWFTQTYVSDAPVKVKVIKMCSGRTEESSRDMKIHSLKSPLKQLPQKIKCCLSTIKSGKYQLSPSNTTGKQKQNKHHTHIHIYVCTVLSIYLTL